MSDGVPMLKSALDGIAAGRTGLALDLAEVFPQGMVTLRADAGEALGAALSSLGLPPLPDVRRSTVADGRRLIWMSPDEWLLLCAHGEAAELAERLDAALDGAPHAVVDVSDARTVLQIRGEGARELLMKGAPVDLHPAAFGVDDVRRTLFAEVACAFWMTGDGPPAFEMVVFRSYAQFVWRFLADSARKDAMVRLF